MSPLLPSGRADDSARQARATSAKYDGYPPISPELEKSEHEIGAETQLPKLRTLGEGPVAPVEAANNARTAVATGGHVGGKGDAEMGYIEPGLKGWLCLLGVSDVTEEVKDLLDDELSADP